MTQQGSRLLNLRCSHSGLENTHAVLEVQKGFLEAAQNVSNQVPVVSIWSHIKAFCGHDLLLLTLRSTSFVIPSFFAGIESLRLIWQLVP